MTKRYDNDGKSAIQDVSLDVAAGEAVAVMGPWGSGKSTLLNARTCHPAEGMGPGDER